jgi:2-polyprenyl-3-methyl-5-hydroxy-6-metoxy-1,4-benzoquinol methylase
MALLFERFSNDGKAELKLNGVQLDAKLSVEQKIKDKVYTFSEINCPICKHDSDSYLTQKDRYGLAFSVKVCNSCGLVYTSPRMTQESFFEFYDNEYRRLYGGEDGATERFFQQQYNHGRQIIGYLEKHKLYPENKNVTVLEIGCGAGGILKAFKERGHKVVGYDLGSEYVDFGKSNHKLDLRVGLLANFMGDKPDVIIYSHVMEHILDLSSELQLIKENCHQDTLVYIEIPGIKNLNGVYEMNLLRYFQNAHTFHFSLDTLYNVFCKNGFQLLVGDESVRTVFKASECNKPVTNDFKNVLAYLKRQEKFRWFYILTIKGMTRTIIKLKKKLF